MGRISSGAGPCGGLCPRKQHMLRRRTRGGHGRREVKRHKDAQRLLNTDLMDFLEPFTSRSNLSTILKKCVDKMHRDYADAKVPSSPHFTAHAHTPASL